MEDHRWQEGGPEGREVDKKRWAGQSSVRPGGARTTRPKEKDEKAADRKNEEETADPGSGPTETEEKAEEAADPESGPTGTEVDGEDRRRARYVRARAQESSDEEHGVEYQVPRMPSRPKMPSQQEKEEHEATGHACYRSWCEHCVAGRARGQYHRSSGEEGETPEIAFDYGYMTKDDTKCLPMICARHRGFRHHAASYVKSKGRNDYAVKILVAWIRGLGHKRVICRSDNERSLLALLQKVSACLPGVEMVPKTSPEGDHSANGLAEIGVREKKSTSSSDPKST